MLKHQVLLNQALIIRNSNTDGNELVVTNTQMFRTIGKNSNIICSENFLHRDLLRHKNQSSKMHQNPLLVKDWFLYNSRADRKDFQIIYYN